MILELGYTNYIPSRINMRKSINCEYCKKEFESSYFVPSRTPRYCSKNCSNLGFIKPKVIVNCLACSKEISFIKWENKKYCSIQCVGTIKSNKGFWQTSTYDEKIEKLKKEFESKVIKLDDGCWDIPGFKRAGYSTIYFDGKSIGAHRAAWMIYKGEIPQNMFICHKDDKPWCCAPDHLFLGTAKDNTQDMIKKGRKSFNQQLRKNAKLIREQVIEIKDLLKNGISQHSIAKQFFVSRGTIQDIHRNKMWKDV